MTEAETYQVLTRLLQRVFQRADLVATPDLMAKDVFGWDSFKQVELLMELQDELNIAFSPEEMDDIASLGALASVVRARVAAGS
jgi:acyl carrier protein